MGQFELRLRTQSGGRPPAGAGSAGFDPERTDAPDFCSAQIIDFVTAGMCCEIPEFFSTGRDDSQPRRYNPMKWYLPRRSPLAARALAIAAAIEHPAYDCFYLALAELRDTRLVTADRRLRSRLVATPWARLLVGLGDVV
ncbi:MAG TPA: type II toxin-antitoxin system VapC family toxin [Acetobacteraceae bacterium]|nr:type II toxin-antitoxin system VapC family toxin [Acetobacteraceae bacterium]